MIYKPYDYQQRATRWVADHPRCCLFLDNRTLNLLVGLLVPHTAPHIIEAVNTNSYLARVRVFGKLGNTATIVGHARLHISLQAFPKLINKLVLHHNAQLLTCFQITCQLRKRIKQRALNATLAAHGRQRTFINSATTYQTKHLHGLCLALSM